MNSVSSKTSDYRRLLLNLSDKINLKWNDKYVSLSNLSIYYTWKIKKRSYKNNEFQTSALMLNDKFELPNVSYSVSCLYGYFEHVIRKHEVVNHNPPIRIYVHKI